MDGKEYRDEVRQAITVLEVGGGNYQQWLKGVKNALGLKSLLKMSTKKLPADLDVQRPKPTGEGKEKAAEEWEDNAEKALAIIRISLGELDSVIYDAETPYDALEIVRQHYSQATKYDQSSLQKSWILLRPESENIIGYIAEMTRIKGDLKTIGIAYSDKSLILQVLSVLDEYPDESPWKTLANNIHFKLQDEPNKVTIEYFMRFVTATQHNVSNLEREKRGDAAFLAKAKRLGYEKTSGSTKNNAAAKSSKPSQPSPLSSLSSMSNALPNSDQRAFVCHYCKQPGHLIRNCTAPGFDKAVYENKREEARKKKMKENGNDSSGGGGNGKGTNQIASLAVSSADLVDESSLDLCELAAAEPSSLLSLSDRTHAALNTTDSYKTFLDSGCTRSMFNHTRYFEAGGNLKPCNVPIRVGDGSYIKAEGVGDVMVHADTTNGLKTTHTFKQALYVPSLSNNLISVSQLDKDGHQIHFGDRKALISKNQHHLSASEDNNLYVLNLDPVTIESSLLAEETAGLWHQRLGHLAPRKFKQLSKLVDGLHIARSSTDERCSTCAASKSIRASFATSSHTATHPLDTVSVDLAGPMQTESIGGARFFLIIVDLYSKYYWVALLRRKSDALKEFKRFHKLHTNLLNYKLKRIRSDNGGEFLNKPFDDYLLEEGIQRETTSPYMPEQNGSAERAVRTCKDGTRSLLIHSKLSARHWGSALLTFVYTRNKTITAPIKGTTPEQRFLGTTPSVSHLRVYGCVAWVHIPKELRTSVWQPKARKCIFVGYGQVQDGSKTYILYDPVKREKLKSIHVTFWEDKFWSDVQQIPKDFDIEETPKPDTPPSLIYLPEDQASWNNTNQPIHNDSDDHQHHDNDNDNHHSDNSSDHQDHDNDNDDHQSDSDHLHHNNNDNQSDFNDHFNHPDNNNNDINHSSSTPPPSRPKKPHDNLQN